MEGGGILTCNIWIECQLTAQYYKQAQVYQATASSPCLSIKQAVVFPFVPILKMFYNIPYNFGKD
ncbi:hypothetical protein J22TS1_01300 [Siminovitchia terrae]|nr:hypothetical protein J22TS1_01300 [Siminovitchia terrae]